MPSYTLYYFNGRGRAELSRMILKQAGVAFEDKRVSGDDWAKLKPNTPFGSLPYMEMGGEVLAQSQALARYLAREHGLAGSSSLEQAKVDEAAEFVADMMTDFYKAAFGGSDEEKAQKMKDFGENSFLGHQEKMEKILSKNKTKSGFLVGSKVTYADLALHCALEYMTKFKLSKAIKENQAKVAALPNIAEWIKERPKSDF